MQLTMAADVLHVVRSPSRVGRFSWSVMRHRTLGVLIVTFALSVIFATTLLAGGVTHMAASWFCLPVVAAGAYLGWGGGLGAAIVAAFLAGPLMPLDVATQAPQAPSLWVARMILFVIVGLLAAAASAQVKRSFQREVDAAESAREVAIRKAAMVEMVSKEFRAPLTVVSASAQALTHEGMVTDAALPLLDGLGTGIRRLTDVVDAVEIVLTDEDHGTGLRWDTFTIGPLLSKIVDHLGIRDPWARVAITVEGPARVCQGDPELLSQMLHNLIDVCVRSSEGKINVKVARPSEQLFTFTLTVPGPGLGERMLLLATDPFGDGLIREGTRRGIGLSLFAAFRLTQAMGGSWDHEEHGGQETVVTVTIPATSPEPLLH
jgi:signal transduction histidine kinase